MKMYSSMCEFRIGAEGLFLLEISMKVLRDLKSSLLALILLYTCCVKFGINTEHSKLWHCDGFLRESRNKMEMKAAALPLRG